MAVAENPNHGAAGPGALETAGLSSEWDDLQGRVGYRFDDLDLLKRAMTHRSFINEMDPEQAEAVRDNQRLEFLGDSVLGLVVAHELFLRDRQVQEGALSTRQAQVVCEPTLARVARALGLGRFLRLGRGEEGSGGRDKDSLLADAVEALLAAVYLDGGLQPAREVVNAHFGGFLDDVQLTAAPDDYKSRLQTLVQRDKSLQPEYRIIQESGPAHQREFSAVVSVDGARLGRGQGRSKKIAEQQAAKMALEAMSERVKAGD